jgi:hypothetical protein
MKNSSERLGYGPQMTIRTVLAMDSAIGHPNEFHGRTNAALAGDDPPPSGRIPTPPPKRTPADVSLIPRTPRKALAQASEGADGEANAAIVEGIISELKNAIPDDVFDAVSAKLRALVGSEDPYVDAQAMDSRFPDAGRLSKDIGAAFGRRSSRRAPLVVPRGFSEAFPEAMRIRRV